MTDGFVNGMILCIFYALLWSAILIYLIRELVAERARVDFAREMLADMMVRNEESSERFTVQVKAANAALDTQIKTFEIAKASYESARNEAMGIRPS